MKIRISIFLSIIFISYCNSSLGQLPRADSVFLMLDKLPDDAHKMNLIIHYSHLFQEQRVFIPGLTFANQAKMIGENLSISKSLQGEWLQMAVITRAMVGIVKR